MVLLKSYKNYNSITMQACYNLIQHGQRIWAMLKIVETVSIHCGIGQPWTWPDKKERRKYADHLS